MIGRRLAAFLGLLLALALAGPSPGVAQPQAPLQARAADLVSLLRTGSGDLAGIFAPSLLGQVSAAQLAAIATQFRARFGAPQRLVRVEPAGPNLGIVFVEYERAVVQIRIAVEDDPPHRLSGFYLIGREMKGDSDSILLAELGGLPGKVSVSIVTLGAPAGVARPALEPERAMAIGSEFKLFVLAELIREIKAGERRWSDVVPLTRHSTPSGQLQDWPIGSPITLHSLAALMISRSDNTAADNLLRLLGREKVEAMAARMGVAAVGRDRPLLTTIEAFAIKADPALTARWKGADEAGRRAMLPALAGAHVDVARLVGNPHEIDSIEWFASTDDMVRVMDWLRVNAGPTALAILAINPQIHPQAAAHFAYVGYKGGSEPGVIATTFLLRRADGGWRSVSASWNNPAAPVDEGRFIDLVDRLVALQR
jgi:hypothetical protein